MATIIKLFLALVVLNAAAQLGMAELKHYRYTDALQNAVLFAPNATDDELAEEAVRLAQEHQVPLDAANVTVSHRGADIVVEGAYTMDVTLVPGVYTRAWKFVPSVSVRSLKVLPATR